MSVASYLVALFGMGIPVLLAWAACYEIATGRHFREGPCTGCLGDQPAPVQAVIVLLVGSTLVLALIGAAVLSGALVVRA